MHLTQTFRYLINSKSKQKTSKTKYTQLKIKVKSLIFVLILLFVSMFSFLLISESVKASGNIPNISNPYPSNESTNQIINTNLSITINDPEGDNMDIIWSNNASTASADWIGVNSSNINSFCGQYDSETYSLAYGLNGNGRWVHDDNHVHWFILDFGDSYFIEKVRGRSNYNMDPIDVNIYVSEINGSWGSPVASNISTWQDTDVWQEVDITDKNGRYIKVEIIETEYSNHILHWGKLSPYLTIFDVYGAANWTTFGSNSSITNGTYTQTCSDFSEYNTTYWWRVIVSDGSSYNESIYHRELSGSYSIYKYFIWR